MKRDLPAGEVRWGVEEGGNLGHSWHREQHCQRYKGDRPCTAHPESQEQMAGNEAGSDWGSLTSASQVDPQMAENTST